MNLKPPDTPHRRRASGGGPALHPAHPSNSLHSESLFGLLSRFSTFVAASAEPLGELVEQATGQKNPLLAQAELRPSEFWSNAQAGVVEALNLCTFEGLMPLTCTPYMTREEVTHHIHSPMLSKTLRYCPRCLQLGFHSMFYQHLAVKECPYHHVPLLNKCMYCAEPWVPSIKQIVSEPFCCTKCRWLHLKTVLPPGGAEELKAASAAIFPQCHDLQTRHRIPHERVNVFALTRGVDRSRESEANRRLWQRVAAWPQLPTPQWHRFREERLCIGMDNWPREGDFRTKDWQELGNGPTATLRWLVQVCGAPAEQCRRLLDGTWQRIQYITPLYQDRQLDAVATALHLTVAKYGWLQINLRALEHGWQRENPYCNVRWSGVHEASTPRIFGAISGDLIESEIRGYFVLSLLRCAGLHALRGPHEEFAQSHHSPENFCPSWLLQREGRNSWLLRMRHRASTEFVLRLLKRYKGRALQRMVVSHWPTSPAIPEVARLGDVDYPPELMQFPRRVAFRVDQDDTHDGGARLGV